MTWGEAYLWLEEELMDLGVTDSLGEPLTGFMLIPHLWKLFPDEFELAREPGLTPDEYFKRMLEIIRKFGSYRMRVSVEQTLVSIMEPRKEASSAKEEAKREVDRRVGELYV